MWVIASSKVFLPWKWFFDVVISEVREPHPCGIFLENTYLFFDLVLALFNIEFVTPTGDLYVLRLDTIPDLKPKVDR